MVQVGQGIREAVEPLDVVEAGGEEVPLEILDADGGPDGAQVRVPFPEREDVRRIPPVELEPPRRRGRPLPDQGLRRAHKARRCVHGRPRVVQQTRGLRIEDADPNRLEDAKGRAMDRVEFVPRERLQPGPHPSSPCGARSTPVPGGGRGRAGPRSTRIPPRETYFLRPYSRVDPERARSPGIPRGDNPFHKRLEEALPSPPRS